MTVLTLRVVASGEIERKPFRCQEVVMGQLGHGVCGGGGEATTENSRVKRWRKLGS